MKPFRSTALVFMLVGFVSSHAAAENLARVAWLGTGTERGSAEFVTAFKQGLKDNSLLEGRDYVFDAVYADNHYDRFPALVRDLLKREPSVIMVVTVSSVRAAQQATKTVPIVMIATTDPVASGLVKTLAHPGGNTTGFGNMAEDLSGKYVQFLRELRPGKNHLGVLINPKNPSSQAVFRRIEKAAQQVGIQAHRYDLIGGNELEMSFKAIAQSRPDALAMIADNSYLDRRNELCALALRYRIPVFAFAPDFADAGCLVGFGSPRRSIFRRSAVYVKRLLNGADPAELPVELPTLFELAINMKTAKSLGVTIPPIVLQRAERLIE